MSPGDTPRLSYAQMLKAMPPRRCLPSLPPPPPPPSASRSASPSPSASSSSSGASSSSPSSSLSLSPYPYPYPPTPPYGGYTPAGPRMGLTANFSPTFLSSGDACLDFFYHVVPSTAEERVLDLLQGAWASDALTALKLVFHLRGVRGTGKSDKKGFYPAALWLHQNHPATLLENLPMVAQFGYFKDLLELVLRVVEGPEEQQRKAEAKYTHEAVIAKGKSTAKVWEKIKESREEAKELRLSRSGRKRRAHSDHHDYYQRVRCPRKSETLGYYGRKGAAARAAKEAGTLKPQEERIAASIAKDQAASKEAAQARKNKKLDLAQRAAKLYASDPKLQALYSKVADVFAARLQDDVKALKEGRPFEISLAGKWVPSLDRSYDRSTLLCSAIATRMFPKEAHPEFEGLNDHEYGVVVKDRLRRDVMVPLRKALELPEVFMSAQKWGEVNYRRVASVAMTNYKGLFQKHDGDRFNDFLGAVKKGEEKVAAGAVLPHDVLHQAVTETGPDAEVAELQWERMVADLKQHGQLNNCIAVCDVSGSMMGTPMDVCIALGMLLAELSDEPWKGHVITFSESPKIHKVKGKTLKEKYQFVVNMHWNCNTNFQKVFDKLLGMALLNKVAPEDMIKRLFVFSDMQFDTASSRAWETDYQAVCRKFADAGYGIPPEIVFWNLSDSSSVPVTKTQNGVALVSGFSKNILKIFLENGGDIDPLKAMRDAISGEEYSKLKVVD